MIKPFLYSCRTKLFTYRSATQVDQVVTEFVDISEVRSGKEKTLVCKVLETSLLCPLLFLIFMNLSWFICKKGSTRTLRR